MAARKPTPEPEVTETEALEALADAPVAETSPAPEGDAVAEVVAAVTQPPEPAPTPEPETPAPEDRRVATAIDTLLHDGEYLRPGDPVVISHGEFLALKRVAVLAEDDWDDLIPAET